MTAIWVANSIPLPRQADTREASKPLLIMQSYVMGISGKLNKPFQPDNFVLW